MEWVAGLLFLSVILILLAGFPVAFTLGGTALIFAGVGVLTGTFNEALLSGLPNRMFGLMTNQTLVAVPPSVMHFSGPKILELRCGLLGYGGNVSRVRWFAVSAIATAKDRACSYAGSRWTTGRIVGAEVI